jgi:hypothetical protein
VYALFFNPHPGPPHSHGEGEESVFVGGLKDGSINGWMRKRLAIFVDGFYMCGVQAFGLLGRMLRILHMRQGEPKVLQGQLC